MSDNCLFCKISKGEIPSKKVFENENVFAFEDIHPQAKIHLLFVHKKHTANINEMSADGESIAAIFRAINEYTQDKALSREGFRVLTNSGPDAGQTVFHTHFHVVGGESLGHFGGRSK